MNDPSKELRGLLVKLENTKKKLNVFHFPRKFVNANFKYFSLLRLGTKTRGMSQDSFLANLDKYFQ